MYSIMRRMTSIHIRDNIVDDPNTRRGLYSGCGYQEMMENE